jgi:excisionase family DNA binding protein
MPAPSRLRPRPAARSASRFPAVLDVHLTAQFLTVSADTVYDLFQRGDLPGRKVGRKWLTTKTAVLKWLDQSATPHTGAAQAAALARAIATGDTDALGGPCGSCITTLRLMPLPQNRVKCLHLSTCGRGQCHGITSCFLSAHPIRTPLARRHLAHHPAQAPGDGSSHANGGARAPQTPAPPLQRA